MRPFSVLNAATGDPVSLGGPDPGLIAIDLSLSTSELDITGGIALSGAILAGNLDVAGTLALTGAASLEAATGTLAGGALLAEGGGATLSVDGTLTITGDAAAAGGGSILAGAVALAGGTLDLDAASAIGVGGAADAGSVAIAAGGTLAGFGQLDAPLEDAGTVLAQGGALALFGTATGSGALEIGAGGTLYAPAGLSPGLSLAFTGPDATLEVLTLAQAFASPLTGFAAGDALDFAEASLTGAVWQAGTLHLTAADGSALALALPGNFTAARFVPLPDGFGGSLVTLPVATVAAVNGATLGSSAGLVAVAGPAAVGSVTVTDQVALTGSADFATLALAGTLDVLAGAALAAGAVSGAGLLAGAGTLTVAALAAFAGTLDLFGGATAAVGAATLAGGAILLDDASQFSLGGVAGQAGSVAIAAAATLAGFGRLAAPVDLAGALLAQGGALVLGGAVAGSGSVAIASGATLEDFAPLSVPVTVAPGGTLALASGGFTGTLDNVAPGAVLDVAGTIDAATWSPGTLALLAGGATVASVAIAGDYSGQTWQATPDGAGGTLVQLAGSGLPVLDVTGSLGIGESETLASASIAAGGVLTLTSGTLATPSLVVAAGGTLVVAGGELAVFGPIGGGGVIQIGSGATVLAAGGIDAATGVMFTGDTATLDLFASAVGVGATLSGLAASPGAPLGNAIDIADAAVTGATYADLGNGTGALALSDAADSLGTLTLAALAAPPSILIEPDGSGGSLIELVPCFVAGTRIATPAGEVAVECLRAGAMVLTADGPRRLRWTGQRHCDSRRAPELRPVRILAGALGDGLPRRDLLVSPRHALLLRGVLAPAVALLNGDTVRREPPGAVAYHHLGLDRHGTVWAEGVAAETWLPGDAAVRFDREDGRRPPPGPACARMVEGGAALAALRRRLFGYRPTPPACGELRGHVERVCRVAGRTRVEGWALNAMSPHEPVILEIVSHSRPVGRAIANRWRPDLDRAGLADGNCAFIAVLSGALTGITLRRRGDGTVLPGPS